MQRYRERGKSSCLLKQSDLFISGEEGYHTYRIPALVVSKKGTILAFCEGRKYESDDAGKIDMVLKRSFDCGRTWEKMSLIVTDGDMTCGNPCPVVDQSDGTIWLPFCKNPGDYPTSDIEGRGGRTAWITRSIDDGASWSEPVEVTEQVKGPSWSWYATGPGHAIQLNDMRLVIPCNHKVDREFSRDNPGHAHVIYSDDHGRSWKTGGIIDQETSESTVVQTVDGALYMNCRSRKHTRRIAAWSQDRGETFSRSVLEENLVDPTCQGSVIRFTTKEDHGKNRILFSNAASTAREKLTIRVSYDECRSWTFSRILNEGPSAYSDLTIAPDMSVCCLYERGEKHQPTETPHPVYEKLTLAQFTIEWLTDEKDRLV